MAFLKFNKAELVNLEYSLKREILGTNSNGAYFNTSIIGCNTRKYHGLLVVPSESVPDTKFVLLSSLDESIVLNGRAFNLGIHCYGDIYEPKGHKYIVDFNADGAPEITYKVGPVMLKKSITIDRHKNQVLISYSLESAPSPIKLQLKPFLAFRNIHELTSENPVAVTSFEEVAGGVGYGLYDALPRLFLQASKQADYRHQPYWYRGVTYSDEYRRGFDCREDLLVPGIFELSLKQGESVVISASTSECSPRALKSQFTSLSGRPNTLGDHKATLDRSAEAFKVIDGGRKKINAGYSWLSTGLLRETIECLPGLTLYSNGSCKEFEEILDNMLEDEKERLFHRTTQIEAPLALADTLQQYIEFAGNERGIWKKYGRTMKGVIESYANREDVSISPNGLLWCQRYAVALTWMNAYINGSPVTERGGFQVETNALWYNALCFALDMEKKYGPAKNAFIDRWKSVADLAKRNFLDTFLIDTGAGYRYLADYVDNSGKHGECRPNMLWAAYLHSDLLDEDLVFNILAKIKAELVTRRGIRTLSPRSEYYRSSYEGSQESRDMSYHNGCTRTSLLGMYVDICFRMMGKGFSPTAKWLTEGIFEDENRHGIGYFSELYDGDPPHEPHGAIASATATAALLRCLYLMNKYKEEEK